MPSSMAAGAARRNAKLLFAIGAAAAYAAYRYVRTHARSHPPTHPRTHPPAHALTHARTHSCTHAPTRPRAHARLASLTNPTAQATQAARGRLRARIALHDGRRSVAWRNWSSSSHEESDASGVASPSAFHPPRSPHLIPLRPLSPSVHAGPLFPLLSLPLIVCAVSHASRARHPYVPSACLRLRACALLSNLPHARRSFSPVSSVWRCLEQVRACDGCVHAESPTRTRGTAHPRANANTRTHTYTRTHARARAHTHTHANMQEARQ